jgi:hypothetical protein
LCEELLLYCEGWAKEKWKFEDMVAKLKKGIA